MSVKAGTEGTVFIGSSSWAEITKWKLSTKSSNGKWASNRSAGFKKALAGVKDGTVSIEGKYDESDPAEDHIGVGVGATLLLKTSSSKYWSVPVVFSSFDLDVDIDGGAPESWSATADTNGAWTELN